MADQEDFLQRVLNNIARRYQLKGQLSGTMKLGQKIDSRQMAELHNFFGLSPIRINAREEVRLYFDRLLESGSQRQWLEKIADNIGYIPDRNIRPEYQAQMELLFERLKLAFPDLLPGIELLAEESGAIERLLINKGEEWLNTTLFRVAETVGFILANKDPITVSELGARFFADSKALRQGELRALVLQWLRHCSFDAEIFAEDIDILTYYNLLSDRLTVNAVIYGPVVYEKKGEVFDWIYQLYRQGEAATVGWSNIQDLDTMYFSHDRDPQPDLICSENEAPFSQLMRQQPHQCLLFTSGFPGSAVQKIYSHLAPRAGNCYHWGDSDPAGLRIAAIMNSIYPLKLYRCDLTTLQNHRSSLLPLSRKQKDLCLKLLMSTPELPFAREIEFTLANGWLEQESWREEASYDRSL
jgi:hypothetical protein